MRPVRFSLFSCYLRYAPGLDRYHLYVCYGCPWAHRTLITRKLKGREDVVSVTVVSPRMGSEGWAFASADPFPGAEDDPVMGAKYLKEVYFSVEPEYAGRYVAMVNAFGFGFRFPPQAQN